jgi:hypothetical protein
MQAEDVISNLLKEYAIDGPGDGENTSEPEAGKGGEGSEDQVPSSIEGSVKQEEDKRPRFKNIVAIVDPPRVGLHHVVSKGSCFPVVSCSVLEHLSGSVQR